MDELVQSQQHLIQNGFSSQNFRAETRWLQIVIKVLILSKRLVLMTIMCIQYLKIADLVCSNHNHNIDLIQETPVIVPRPDMSLNKNPGRREANRRGVTWRFGSQGMENPGHRGKQFRHHGDRENTQEIVGLQGIGDEAAPLDVIVKCDMLL